MINPITIGDFNTVLSFIKEIPPYFRFPETIIWGTYLYAFQINNNKLKIGRSDNITSRIKSHNENCILYGNRQIEKIAIFGTFDPKFIKDYETELLKSIKKSKKFTKIPQGREWFLGDFNDMINLISNLKFNTIASPPYQIDIPKQIKIIIPQNDNFESDGLPF